MRELRPTAGPFGQAFRTPDLRKKMLFVLAIVLLFRLGSAIPTPGVSEKNINTCLVQVTGGNSANVYTLINLFSGGALLSCRSSRWASCPTSRRASSFSCSSWSFRGSSS